MHDTKVLIEPSFSDAIRAVEAAQELPARTRQHWACSLRRIAQMLGRPPELLPARWTAMRGPISRLHHSGIGIERQTLANHKANVLAALAWFMKVEKVPRRGVPLSPAWAALSAGITCMRTRRRLSSPMRYWSARCIAPDVVDEAALDAYMRYRAETTVLSADDTARRSIARAWNHCACMINDWPPQNLIAPACKALTLGPRWETFAAELRADVEVYLSGLLKVRKSARGRRYRPCKASTIKVRRARLIAFARKAVACGVPIERLASLRDMLSADVVECVLQAYWPDREEPPRIYVIELFSLLFSISFTIPDIDPASVGFLEDTRAELESYRSGGLTEKNLALIRQVLTPGVWSRVVSLPVQLMSEARESKAQSPVKAAVLAQMACAISILCHQTGHAPPSAGRPGCTLLAGFSQLRCEKPGAA